MIKTERARTWLLLFACVVASIGSGRADGATPEAAENSAAEQSGEDWADFLGPGRTSKSSETGLLQSWSQEGPPIVWQAELGAGYTAPAISGGRLVHYGRFDDQLRLTCRDALTGDMLWKDEHSTDYSDMLGYNNGPRSSPTIDDGLVFTISAAGLLRCVRLVDGELVWSVDTAERYRVVDNFFGVGSTSLVWRDLVIANIGGSPPGEAPDVYSAGGRVRGDGTGVVAFDKRTGKEVWRASDELASYASPVVARYADRWWCFVLARGGLVALNPDNGQVDFQFPWRAGKLESVNASSPVVIDNRVFISETYELGAALVSFDGGVAKPIWTDRERRRDKALMLHWNTPVLHDGVLYGSSGRHAGTAELRAVEAATGKVLWSEPGLGRASLIYADGKLICLSEDGILRLLEANRRAYTLISEHRPVDDRGRRLLTGDTWVGPVLSHGLLYVRGEDRLVCFNLAAPRDAEKKAK